MLVGFRPTSGVAQLLPSCHLIARDTLSFHSGYKPLAKRQIVAETIWHAAIERFGAHGYSGTTIEQIAETSGVSRRTFLRYFASKEDIVGFSMDAYGDLIVQAIQESSHPVRPIEIVRAAIMRVAEFVWRSPPRVGRCRSPTKIPRPRSPNFRASVPWAALNIIWSRSFLERSDQFLPFIASVQNQEMQETRLGPNNVG